MSHVKLHIPGPVEVSEKTFRAFCSPMIGHRGQGFKDLYAEIQPRLQSLFYTRRLVYLGTSSAWGVMEGAIRNLVARKVLCCMCGAFSDKWLDVARRCGKTAEALQVDWGQPIRAEAIQKKLSGGGFDAVTLIHNETSTGTMSPLPEIAALKKEFPGVTFIVDAVSSLSALKIEFDTLGIDVLLAGCQKALALPPGLTLFTCSAAALEKAAAAKDRGYYFDLAEFQKNAEAQMTPSTPSISHVFALRSKLEDIFTEGLEARFQRHLDLAGRTRAWAAKHGFTLFPAEGFASVTLTCVNNGAKPGGRVVDILKLQKFAKEHGFLIDAGYGKIKGSTFRISNMGDETAESMGKLYAVLDAGMAKL